MAATPGIWGRSLNGQGSHQTRGYTLPFSRNQDNVNEFNTSNQQQAGNQNDTITLSQPYFSSYPIPPFTPSVLHTRPNQNPYGAVQPGNQESARSEFPSLFMQQELDREVEAERSEANTTARVPSTHLQGREFPRYIMPNSSPWAQIGHTGNNPNNLSSAAAIQESDNLFLQPGAPQGNNPSAPSAGTPPATSQRRRSAQAMGPEHSDHHHHDTRVGSDGITRRRVRMRPLRVSPASSSRPEPTPSATISSTPPPLANSSYSGHFFTTPPLPGDSYMDAMGRTLDVATAEQSRLLLIREQRQAQRRFAEHLAQGKELQVGLDVEKDGRPEPMDSEKLTINMECKVCMSQLVDTVLIPCGHAVLCRWCADQHMQNIKPGISRRSNPTCPMCRKPVRQKLRIFIS
ncbi:C3HC4 finger protein [Arthroderma uncinatum]|uniref:C3HC4 finger protein n=1 Tax=Arthroderma uncinatum TaxID=74035 RepID=UPI00144ACC06|nr:C3HC4 finger protein [Arthroderma uncinatum]KAF3479851.1 C3HC4 finger protein [Arthroderma uncinatum]